LVVDDEPSILHAFGRVFHEPGVNLLMATSALKSVQAVSEHRPDVVILDVQLPDLSGLEAFQQIKKIDARIPVIFITGHGTTDTAIEAIKLGAIDYLFKPLDLPKLREVVANAFEISRLMRIPATLAEQEFEGDEVDSLVGRCPTMNEVYKQIGRVAPQDMPVLILGESGTGKELVARAIWGHSKRSASPFLAINCAAIPDTLLESELFGHERGAFTGADNQRIGKFEQCRGGTLFLDEIGDMTPAAQAKILRVIQEQEFERVGGNQIIHTDVRLIAATNRDLQEMLDTDALRRDLYYRLSVVTITLPPLRERGEDVSILAEYFLHRFRRSLDKDVLEISTPAIDMLKQYSWPGNVRELQSVVKQALLRAAGPVLIPEFLPNQIHSGQSRAVDLDQFDLQQMVSDWLQADSEGLYAQAATAMERYLLSRVLGHTKGNQVQAARILGITRSTLRNKIRSLGLHVPNRHG